MVCFLDGCSSHYAHIWSKSDFQFVEGIHGYIERVVTSDFLFRKRPISLYTCATSSEVPFCLSTIEKISYPDYGGKRKPYCVR